MDNEETRREPRVGRIADAYSPPDRVGGLRNNRVMLAVIVVLAVAMLVFVVALALQ